MTRHRDTFDMFEREDRGRFGDNESVRSNADVRSDLIDLSLALHVETPAKGKFNQGAILVSDNGDETRAVWIPKSLCEFERSNSFLTGKRKNGSSLKLQFVTVTLSERFAKEKGLI
jgi:hypothetical protein